MSTAITRQPWFRALLVVGGLSLVAGVSFILTRETRVMPGAEAQPVGTPKTAPSPLPTVVRPGPGDAVPDNKFAQLLASEAAEPRFAGEVNGIRIAPGLEQSAGPCESQRAIAVPVASTVGTSLEIDPRLPAGSELDFEEATSCGDVLAAVARGFTYPAGDDSKFGGSMTVVRSVGAPESGEAISALRVKPDTIAGRSAVVVPPLTSDGFGRSTVIVKEPWGLTTLTASGLTTAKVREIAESIYEGQ